MISSALQYGLTGLAALLFFWLVRLLQLEQRRDEIRPGFLRAIYVAMAVSVVFLLVAAGTEIAKEVYLAKPLNATIRTLTDDLNGAKATIATLTPKAGEAAAIKERLRGELGGLEVVENLKRLYVLQQIKEPEPKRMVMEIVFTVCSKIQDLKALYGDTPRPERCSSAKNLLQEPN